MDYAIEMSMESNNDALLEIDGDLICHTVSGKPIKPKTLGQKQYVDAIRRNMIVFGMGPAVYSRTYLAMAMPVRIHLRTTKWNGLSLPAPPLKRERSWDFCPAICRTGRPAPSRALYQIMGAESFVKNMEKGLIEVAPLAYMRGRTLDNAYIILDEAQNTTPAQMKMFLTRIGFGSKVIITGDSSGGILCPV